MSVVGEKTWSREVNIISLIHDGRGLQPEDCKASVQEEYNRLRDCCKLERLIDRIWECTREKKPCLANKCKFRLHGIDTVKVGEEVPEEKPEGEEGEEGAEGEGEEEAEAPPEEEPPAEGEEGEEGAEPKEEEKPEGEEEVCRTISVASKITMRREYPEGTEVVACTFKLGLCFCKEFIGTNCLPYHQDVQQLLVLGSTNWCNRGAYFAHPLGVGILVRTADDPPRYVFLRRINECCESRPLIDRAGATPSPEKIPLPLGENDLANAKPEDLVNEIFSSATRAAVEELGIPEKTLTDLELLGIVLNQTKGERPTAEFHANCEWQMDKILYQYNRCRHSGKNRSQGIIFTTEKEIKETRLPQSMFFMGLAPCAKGAILLLRRKDLSAKEYERRLGRQKKGEEEAPAEDAPAEEAPEE